MSNGAELFDGVKHWRMHRIRWNCAITNVKDQDPIRIWLEGADIEIMEPEIGYCVALLCDFQMKRFVDWASRYYRLDKGGIWPLASQKQSLPENMS
jgi:hypothetical protein